MDYEAAYYFLFRRITNALEEIEKSKFISLEMVNAINILKASQIETEIMYVEGA